VISTGPAIIGPRILDEELNIYLERLMSGFPGPAPSDAEAVVLETVPERVFDVLTSRDFCYLSKARVAAYRDSVLSLLAASVRRREPLRFYYDIGGGYHASIQPGAEDVSFEVGLAELFVLRQAAEFAARVSRLYPDGVRFTLVIDNMCALLVNDIPTARTLAYCEALRELVRNVGLEDLIDVLVESEHFSTADFDRARAATRSGPIALTQKQHENVARFLGRPCDEREALDRTQRYAEVVGASEQLLTPLILGVHMTQRATKDTICFRPFPGGDSRIQCGEVAITRNNNLKLCPMLLTSGNVGYHRYHRYRFPEPAVIPHVTYAERLAA
jgi:hypothetical protein